MGQITNELGRVLPQSIPLEEAVLGALLMDRTAFDIVCDVLSPAQFYLESHQLIYKAICGLSSTQSPIDLLTVTEELKRKGDLDRIGGGYYLVELSNRVASSANIEHHARIISQNFIKRELIRVANETLRDAYADTEEVFELYDRSVSDTLAIMSPFETTKNVVSVGEAAQRVLKEIDRQMSGVGSSVIHTGLKRLDDLSGGFFPGELTIIAARPGMGKTEIALTCARHAGLTQKKAHFVTLEMTAEQLARRLMSSRSGVGTGKIRRAELDEVQIKALQEAAQWLNDVRLNISAHRTIGSLWQFVRRASAKKEIDVLFIDYAQLMEDDGGKKGGNREQEISAISRTLKRISTEFNIPVVLLAQLSRAVESRSDKMPQLSDLRESGSLEQDADNVYFLVRLDQYGIFEYNEAYDNILPAGTHSTAGKILVYSRKFRSDSQFGLMLDFVNGHILDSQSELTQFPIDPSEQSRIIEAARPDTKFDVPF